jgi:hypothetical protein
MLTAAESPKWEAKTRLRTGVREYQVEISQELFWKLRVLVKGKNLADPDSPDKLTVSGQAETDAIRHVAQSGNERQAQP